MPVVQPAELWQESGRWEKYGPELLRVKDRHQRDFIVQPTSEEVITDIARKELASYKQLPVNFYHIQTKFRDEIRPRFGVMRGREFTMKDAYSFDRDHAALRDQLREDASRPTAAVFERMGLKLPARRGRQRLHRRHRLARVPRARRFGARTRSRSARPPTTRPTSRRPRRIAPGTRAAPVGSADGRSRRRARRSARTWPRCLGIPLERTVKSIVLADRTSRRQRRSRSRRSRSCWSCCAATTSSTRSRRASCRPWLGAGFRFATEAEIVETFGTKPGYLGPFEHRRSPSPSSPTAAVAAMSDFVVGANEIDFHVVGVNWGRDLPEPQRRGRP